MANNSGGPSNIGGPKITGSVGGIKKVTIKPGGYVNIVIYNNTPDNLSWNIAKPLPALKWLIITPEIGDLSPQGKPGWQATIKVQVAEMGPFVPDPVEVVFGWNPESHPKSADTLEVTVTQ